MLCNDGVGFVAKRLELGCKFDKPYEAKCFVEMVIDNFPEVEVVIGDDCCVYVTKHEGKGKELIPKLTRYAGHDLAISRVKAIVHLWTTEARASNSEFVKNTFQIRWVFGTQAARDFCLEIVKARLPGIKMTLYQDDIKHPMFNETQQRFLIDLEKAPGTGEELARHLVEQACAVC